MSDQQNFSGIISPVTNLPTTCGQHIGWGNAPSPLDPWGFWWDTVLDAPAITNGNATATTYLPKGNGTSGQVLTSNGAAAVPTWQSASGGFLYQSTKRDSVGGNVTTLTTLVALDTIAAGLLNVVGRQLIIRGKGHYTTALGEVPTIQLDVYMAASSRASIITGAVTASQTAIPFEFEFTFQTYSIGAVGQLVRASKMLISLNGTTFTNYLAVPDTNTIGFDLTGTLAPIVTVTCGATALTQIVVRETYAEVN